MKNSNPLKSYSQLLSKPPQRSSRTHSEGYSLLLYPSLILLYSTNRRYEVILGGDYNHLIRYLLAFLITCASLSIRNLMQPDDAFP